MFNLEETFELNNYYNTQNDFFFKSIFYFAATFILIELIRNQIPEIKLLQLFPGLNFFLLFLALIFFVSTSLYLLKIPIKIEITINSGSKGLIKIYQSLAAVYSLFFFFFLIILNLNTVIPITLDSFSSYEENTLENLWSFPDIASLESFLILILTILSQLPIFISFYLKTEKDLSIFPNFWRLITLSIVTLSGFLTPTIDGYTQLCFSASAFSVFLGLLWLLKKRLNIQLNTFAFIGF
jgi:hypothetical protein